MLYGLTAYIEYFRTLCATHKDQPTFIFGSSERVLRRQSVDLDYPLVWMAWPVKEVLPNGNERFTADLFFLANASNEEEEEDTALMAMYNLSDDFHKKMVADAAEGNFGYEGNAVFQPKFRFSGDNDAGYVLEAGLLFGTSGCLDDLKFPN